jgi:hypothetical protein
MIDLLASTVSGGMPSAALIAAKRAVFLAVLEEEDVAGRCQRGLTAQIRLEVAERLG